MVTPFRSACFFSTDNGATVKCRHSAADETSHPQDAGVTNLYRFDEGPANNQSLLDLWDEHSEKFTMSGGTVLVDDLAAGFDPPGLLFRALANAAVIFAKLESTDDPLSREEQAQIAAIGFSAKGLLG